MEMKYKVFFLLISVIFLSGTALATSLTLKSAAQAYYIDPQHNLWLKVDMNGSTQHFNVHNTLGYSPNGDAVMWAYDNFSSGNLNTSKWTAYKKGSNNSTVEVQNGHLVLSGSGNTSSANVVLNKPFTNGIELAINETLTGGTHNLGTFSDVSFGSGTPVGGIRGTDWWHTHFKAGGGSFQSQGIDKAMIWVNSNSSDINVPIPGIRLSDYVQENISHTVAYSYDSSSNANMYMLNVTQNRLPLSIPDPYGYNQFNHPSIYFNETGVFGHKWWMFITPYAYSRGELENACLYYSDDGLVWHVPPGVKNPIGTPIESEYESNAYGLDPYGSDPYGSDSRGSDPYGSDSHIIYNPDTGKFLCYYVIGDVVGDKTLEDPKVKIYDGITVSPQINVKGHGVSPAVLYDEATRTYYMWIVDINHRFHRLCLGVAIHEQEPRRPVVEHGRLLALLRNLVDMARGVVVHLELGRAIGLERPRPAASDALGELFALHMARVPEDVLGVIRSRPGEFLFRRAHGGAPGESWHLMWSR